MIGPVNALAKLLSKPEAERRAAGYVHTAEEIAAQPELWRLTGELMAGLMPRLSAFLGPSPRLLLSGAGSSHYVGISVAPALSRVFPRVEAIPSTEIVMDPESAFPREAFILLSFARSGDSPEGNAVVALAEKLRPTRVRHIVITCNPSGGLSGIVDGLGSRGLVVVLPEGTNDKSLAMTSSFSSMALAGLCLGKAVLDPAAAAEACRLLAVSLATVGGNTIAGFSDLAAKLASGGFHRAFFLASRPFFGGALEAHLKVQELSGGSIVSKAEDSLGLRHGFMAAIDKESLVLLYFSSDPYRREYEVDLAKELKAKGLGKKVIAIAESAKGLDGLADVVFETGGAPGLTDEARAIIAVLPGQLLGFFFSLALGLKPDAPSPSGVINRVVQGVVIHPYPDGKGETLMRDPFEDLVGDRARGKARGLYSVCSSHPIVLEAAVRRAAVHRLPILVEATANQVNQDGGYTGMRPADFAARLAALCDRCNVPTGLVTFGGDHLGPHPWRKLPAARAMEAACRLVSDFVKAGARKIHLDASMSLGDDKGSFPEPGLVASRAALLCGAAEGAYKENLARGGPPEAPVYVIGTEVPVPGGVVGEEGGDSLGPRPTRAAAARSTIELHERAFMEAGLGEAWRRVMAVVVQPGVEFESTVVHPYRREGAAGLALALASRPGLFFEGHSTDYQSNAALRELVEDGFAFLKVGPALTFAMREALFGLARIEAELDGGRGEGKGLEAVLRRAMLEDDGYWKDYYQRADGIALLYSLSDRARYYWDKPVVAAEVERLLASLSGRELAPGLLSQHLPRLGGPQFAAALGGPSASTQVPRELVIAAVDAELARYEAACFPGEGKTA